MRPARDPESTVRLLGLLSIVGVIFLVIGALNPQLDGLGIVLLVIGLPLAAAVAPMIMMRAELRKGRRR